MEGSLQFEEGADASIKRALVPLQTLCGIYYYGRHTSPADISLPAKAMNLLFLPTVRRTAQLRQRLARAAQTQGHRGPRRARPTPPRAPVEERSLGGRKGSGHARVGSEHACGRRG